MGKGRNGKGAGARYQCTGKVDACCSGVGAVEPLWFRESKESMGRHDAYLIVGILSLRSGGML